VVSTRQLVKPVSGHLVVLIVLQYCMACPESPHQQPVLAGRGLVEVRAQGTQVLAEECTVVVVIDTAAVVPDTAAAAPVGPTSLPAATAAAAVEPLPVTASPAASRTPLQCSAAALPAPTEQQQHLLEACLGLSQVQGTSMALGLAGPGPGLGLDRVVPAAAGMVGSVAVTLTLGAAAARVGCQQVGPGDMVVVAAADVANHQRCSLPHQQVRAH
jgi:hypothetical protein